MMRGRNIRRVAKLALALLAPVREQVALEHAGKLELARRGLLEPLLGAGMSLDLGHDARLRFMPHSAAFNKAFVAVRDARRARATSSMYVRAFAQVRGGGRNDPRYARICS